MTTDELREKFEAWHEKWATRYVASVPNSYRRLGSDSSFAGDYEYESVQYYWEAYQAGYQAAHEAMMKDVYAQFDVACLSYNEDKSVYDNLSRLQAWHVQIALDPKVSKEADELLNTVPESLQEELEALRTDAERLLVALNKAFKKDEPYGLHWQIVDDLADSLQEAMKAKDKHE